MMAGKLIRTHRDLQVFQNARDSAMTIFFASKAFPKEETYSLTDQIRRSSRSVAANITEAWRKRRYEAAFVAKLNDAEGEAAETQMWVEFAVLCGYLPKAEGRELYKKYDAMLGALVGMIMNSERWVLKHPTRKGSGDR